MLRRNPAKQWIDRKVLGPPADWLAWRSPEWLTDRLLGWHYMHCGPGRIPTRREWARIRAAARSLPLTTWRDAPDAD